MRGMGRNCVFWTKEDIGVMNRERQGGISKEQARTLTSRKWEEAKWFELLESGGSNRGSSVDPPHGLVSLREWSLSRVVAFPLLSAINPPLSSRRVILVGQSPLLFFNFKTFFSITLGIV